MTVLSYGAFAGATPRAVAARGPHCSHHDARVAAQATSLADRMARVTGTGPIDWNHWGIFKLVCRDLTGDGRTDMAVVFDCCTITAPTPLFIFIPRAGTWRLSFGAMSPLIYGLRVRRRELIEHRPVYVPSDSLCCPSSYHDWTVRYTGHGWAFHRIS